MKKSTLLRRKPIKAILEESANQQDGLKKVLSAIDLTAIGVGAIIGAGIFVLTGTAARDAAGPAIMLSYVFAGIACILAALCYAEFATRLPIAGSAYTYAYASVGEIFAWIIGWDLILEYTIGGATVAVGWTHYLTQFIEGFGLHVPKLLVDLPLGPFHANPAAIVLIALLSTLLCIGIKESARFNALMVVIKLLVIAFVITAGIPWVKPEHWTPFFPFGVQGIFSGAALIFFAYIGFDAVSTAAEEVINPQRDLPIGIIASLAICTLLYVIVSGVITGMVPYQLIDAGAPLAAAFGQVGNTVAQRLIGIGGFVGLTTVVLILLMSQPRIYFAMARDGLLPGWFSRIHPHFRTPVNASILTGIVAILTTIFFPMEELHHMVSIGTLFAFVVVSASVLMMRYRDTEGSAHSIGVIISLIAGIGFLSFALAVNMRAPFLFLKHQYVLIPTFATGLKWFSLILGSGLFLSSMASIFNWKENPAPSTFRCPGMPWVPIAAIAGNLYMMVNLNLEAWVRLFIWLIVGLLLYKLYGHAHSRLNHHHTHLPK
jgi:basic amino acid/polyamine antiporter, APA family